MPTLNIKDPQVYRLASELAARRHVSMTAAVRQALEAAITAESRRREGRLERLNQIAQRSAARPEPVLTDDDLYDERGLPR